MQRNVVIPIVGGVLAAVVLVAAILVIGHRHKSSEITITSPAASVTPVPPPTESPGATSSPMATPTPSASGSPKASASSAPATSAKPTPTPHATRPVSSVDCSKEPKYCSKLDGAVMKNKKASTPPQNPQPASYPDSATITMKSTVTGTMVHVVVTVENKTKKTFHFPDREIQWDITKNGKHLDTLTTHGAAFDMAPGGKMTGTFDEPIPDDGTYLWQAKTWYYVK